MLRDHRESLDRNDLFIQTRAAIGVLVRSTGSKPRAHLCVLLSDVSLVSTAALWLISPCCMAHPLWHFAEWLVGP